MAVFKIVSYCGWHWYWCETVYLALRQVVLKWVVAGDGVETAKGC